MASPAPSPNVFVQECFSTKRCRTFEASKLQSAMASRFEVIRKRLLAKSVMGALNSADIATKRFSAGRLESLCYFLGIWRGNSLEEGSDAGNIFRHLSNQRQQGHS